MYKDFGTQLQIFFENYLVGERGSSKNTLRSYRDCFVQFIDYLTMAKKIKPRKITMEMMERSLIVDFLNWLEKHHHCSVQTRNQRLSCMRSFFNFMMYQDPVHLAQWKGVCTIKMKKCEQGKLNYLTIEAVAELLRVIDTRTFKGLRNLTMLSLLYNSGIRVQELIDLTPSCLSASGPHCIKVFGKGNKHRIVPLDDAIVELLNKYLNEAELDLPGREHHPMFFNSWHSKLTPPGVCYVLKKYFDVAKAQSPNLFPNKISPHVFRHSRAMHLLQAGVKMIYIRDIFGHASITTTEIYARADTKAKRKALEGAYASIGIVEPEIKAWKSDNKLKELLQNYKF